MGAVTVDKGRVEHRHFGHEARQGGKIVMAHGDRAHLDPIHHLGHPTELAGRIDRDGDLAIRCGIDPFGGLSGEDRLDVAFGAHMGVAQFLCVCSCREARCCRSRCHETYKSAIAHLSFLPGYVVKPAPPRAL